MRYFICAQMERPRRVRAQNALNNLWNIQPKLSENENLETLEESEESDTEVNESGMKKLVFKRVNSTRNDCQWQRLYSNCNY